MSSFLVPSSVVARRKGPGSTRSHRSVSGDKEGPPPPPGIAAPPPGFSVPTVNLVNQQEQSSSSSFPENIHWQYTSTSNCQHLGPPAPLYQYSFPTASSLLPENIFAGMAEPLTCSAAPPIGITAAFTDNIVLEEPDPYEDSLLSFSNPQVDPFAPSVQDSPENLTLSKDDDPSELMEEIVSPTDCILPNDNLNAMVKTIARENIEGSPFHTALLQKLQSSNTLEVGMTLTQVLSVLLGFPELLHLFCTVQNQYGITPSELIRELSHVERSSSTFHRATGEELFVYRPLEENLMLDPAEAVDSSTNTYPTIGGMWDEDDGIAEFKTTFQPEEAEETVAKDDVERTTNGLEVNEAESDAENWESNVSDDEASANGGAEVERSLPETTDATTANSNDIGGANARPVSSTSTSPTTVSTTACSSLDMDENEDLRTTEEELLRQPHTRKQKGQYGCIQEEDGALNSVEESDHSKIVAKDLNSYLDCSAETATLEDRNDGHVTPDNGEDRQEDKPKQRDDTEFNAAREIENNPSPTPLVLNNQMSEAPPRDDATNGNGILPAVANVAGEITSERVAVQTTQNRTGGKSLLRPPMPLRPRGKPLLLPEGKPPLQPLRSLRPDQKKHPLPFHIRNSPDAMAALGFLVLLHKACQPGTRSWPETEAELKTFLVTIIPFLNKDSKRKPRVEIPPELRAWCEDGKKRWKAGQHPVRNFWKHATKELVTQLTTMACIKMTSLSLIRWMPLNVENLVACYNMRNGVDGEAKESDNVDSTNETSAFTTVEEVEVVLDDKGKENDKVDSTSETSSSTISDQVEDVSDNKGSLHKEVNIWDQRKVAALVTGNQPKEKVSPTPTTSPKSDLGLVVLKKRSRPSTEKSLLSGSIPSKASGGLTPFPRDSAWKVSLSGSLQTSKPVRNGESKEGKKTNRQVYHSPPNVLHPKCVDDVHQRQPAPGNVAKVRKDTNESKHLEALSQAPESMGSTRGLGMATYMASTFMGTSSRVDAGSEESPISPLLSQPLVALAQAQSCKGAVPVSTGSLEPPDSIKEFSAPTPLEVRNDVPILLELLPEDLACELFDPVLQQQLSDIVLDKGRRPVIWASGVRKFLGEEHRIVSSDDINSIVEKLGGFGSSNRIGMDQQLHSISAIRNRKNDIIGLSMRVGRHISGIANMISDLLYSDPSKSILFLGEPGSGKTTILREVTRVLAMESDVMIVDTVNELAGDGDIPHPCVGQARRMMVPSLVEQGIVMMECIENHAPEIMVVDKLGTPDEVMAALTARELGVRLISSMNGNLQKLVKNTKLQGFMGVETVFMGQPSAKSPNTEPGAFSFDGGPHLQAKRLHRTGTPAFDVVVEVSRGNQHEWRVAHNSAEAVDCMLEGREYLWERRLRDPLTGSYSLQMENL